MNNGECRIRDGLVYPQSQSESQWVSFDDENPLNLAGFTISDYGEGPGLKQWIRVKDDWTDLANFVTRCRVFGFPDTHPYGELTNKMEDKVMTFDQNAL